MWPWKPKTKNKPVVIQNYNVYNLLNDELQRLHNLVTRSIPISSENATLFMNKVVDVHMKIDTVIEKMPDNELLASVKDIQHTIAELMLLGNVVDTTDSKILHNNEKEDE